MSDSPNVPVVTRMQRGAISRASDDPRKRTSRLHVHSATPCYKDASFWTTSHVLWGFEGSTGVQPRRLASKEKKEDTFLNEACQ